MHGALLISRFEQVAGTPESTTVRCDGPGAPDAESTAVRCDGPGAIHSGSVK